MSWQRRQWEASNQPALQSRQLSVPPHGSRLFRLSRHLDVAQAAAISSAFIETAGTYDRNVGRLSVASFYRSLSITVLSVHDIRRLGLANLPAQRATYMTELADRTGTSLHALMADTYRCSVTSSALGRLMTIGVAVNGVEGRAMQEERRVSAEIIQPGGHRLLRPHFPNVIVGTIACDGFDSDAFKTEFNLQTAELGNINLAAVQAVEPS